jgi:UDP-N-acetylglucosamine acyltransferase
VSGEDEKTVWRLAKSSIDVSHIHPLAAVSPRADIAVDVRIGPFCVVEDDVAIGRGCRLESGAVIKSGTALGENNHVGECAVLGGAPQHVTLPGEGGLVVGSGNKFREHVTIHRSLKAGKATVVGDNNLLMVNAHVAHDCRVGNATILVNNVMLAGHVEVGDRAVLAGAVGVHQFCRIGRLAMVGGQTAVKKDIPPFVMVDGGTSLLVGLNVIGLRRAGFSRDEIQQLKDAYRLIYRSGLSWADVLARLEEEFPAGPAAEFRAFFAGGTRSFTPARIQAEPATIKLHDEVEELRRMAG